LLARHEHSNTRQNQASYTGKCWELFTLSQGVVVDEGGGEKNGKEGRFGNEVVGGIGGSDDMVGMVGSGGSVVGCGSVGIEGKDGIGTFP